MEINSLKIKMAPASILTQVELGKCSQTRRLTDNFATREA
jgi:hypothetical protein